MGRSFAIMGVSALLVFILKVSVAAICAGTVLGIFPQVYDVTSPLMPALIVFIGAYAVCSAIMMVFDAMIDTIFLCFLIDEEANKPPRQMMAHKSLAVLVQSQLNETPKDNPKVNSNKVAVTH